MCLLIAIPTFNIHMLRNAFFVLLAFSTRESRLARRASARDRAADRKDPDRIKVSALLICSRLTFNTCLLIDRADSRRRLPPRKRRRPGSARSLSAGRRARRRKSSGSTRTRRKTAPSIGSTISVRRATRLPTLLLASRPRTCRPKRSRNPSPKRNPSRK